MTAYPPAVQNGILADAWKRAQARRVVTLHPTRRQLHARQIEFASSLAKRIVIRAGRRGGKTVGVADIAAERFAAGKRVLYAAPTQEQIDAFWWEITTAFADDIEAKRVYKNETKHMLEIPGTKKRIRAKTAWNADTLRGDYADVLILDEWQLMNEDAWERVGAPMLLDNNGDAIFVYTPPSLHSRSMSKAGDPMHAAKMYKQAAADLTGRWAVFHFTSRDNPYISAQAIDDLTHDMSALAIKQEIDAEDIDEAPGALWKRADIDRARVTKAPDLFSLVVAVDPSTTSGGDEAGIIVAGVGMCDCKGTPERHGFVIADASIQGSPETWARAAVSSYNVHHADRLVAESNQGGEMVSLTIATIPNAPSVKLITASRGKATRAEPVSALYEQGRVHHVGTFAKLEDEMCQWTPGDPSPNRMDALVWAITELQLVGGGSLLFDSDLAELAREITVNDYD